MNTWQTKKLGEVAIFKRGPFGGSLKKEIFVSHGYKVYEQKNAIYNDFSLGKYFITEEKYKNMSEFSVKSGDLIISCSGTIGKVAIVPGNILPGIINQALLKITPIRNCVSGAYLKYLIQSQNLRSKMFGSARGSSIKNIVSIKEIKNISVCLPSLKLQKLIVNKLDAIKKLGELKNQEKNLISELFESNLNKEMKNRLGN